MLHSVGRSGRCHFAYLVFCFHIPQYFQNLGFSLPMPHLALRDQDVFHPGLLLPSAVLCGELSKMLQHPVGKGSWLYQALPQHTSQLRGWGDHPWWDRLTFDPWFTQTQTAIVRGWGTVTGWTCSPYRKYLSFPSEAGRQRSRGSWPGWEHQDLTGMKGTAVWDFHLGSSVSAFDNPYN